MKTNIKIGLEKKTSVKFKSFQRKLESIISLGYWIPDSPSGFRDDISRQHIKKTGNTGQAAIFILMMFSLIFMFFGMAINIGMLVHHKINLQNAADMAALAAAAEQARMLNMIGWKNYELRKNFKDFMYNYWISANDRHRHFPDPRPAHATRNSQNIIHQGRWTVNPLRGSIAVPSYCAGDIFGERPVETKNCELGDNFPQKVAHVPDWIVPSLGAVGSLSTLLALGLQKIEQEGNIRVKIDYEKYTDYNRVLALQEKELFRERAEEIYQTYLNTFKPSSLPGMMNQRTFGIPQAWQNFTNTFINNPDPERSLKHLATPFEEPEPQNFHDLAFQTALRNLNLNNRFGNFILEPLTPASGEYVRLKKIETDFFIFYTDIGQRQVRTITHIPIVVDNFTVGVEKDPDVKTFYALKLTSEPQLPFLPGLGDRPWKLTAFASASPFGSRIGPKRSPNDDNYRTFINLPGLGSIAIPHIYIDDGQSIDDTQVLHDLKKEGEPYESAFPEKRAPILSPNKWDEKRYIFPNPQTTKNQFIHWTDQPFFAPQEYSNKFGAQDLKTSWDGRPGYSMKLIPIQSIAPFLAPTDQDQLTDILH